MLPFPNHIRVQGVMVGLSGLPEDRFINTFHFRTKDNTPPSAAQLAEASDAVVKFYNLPGPVGNALGTYYSPIISRVAGKCFTRAYDLGQLEPRTPTDAPFTLQNPTVSTPLPNEVAVCLSYYGDSNVASQRGRLYAGPLTTQALATESSAPDVADVFRTALLSASQVLATACTTIDWVILQPALPARQAKDGGSLPSRVNQSVLIKNAWVDDEFDTQRRRGLKARSRLEALVV